MQTKVLTITFANNPCYIFHMQLGITIWTQMWFDDEHNNTVDQSSKRHANKQINSIAGHVLILILTIFEFVPIGAASLIYSNLSYIQPLGWQSKITEYVNTLRPRQDSQRFVDDIFKCIFWNEGVWSSINISFKFVPYIIVKLTIFQYWFR